MQLSDVIERAIKPAYALLPASMRSREATVMLLAIGLQESAFKYRRQIKEPARGFLVEYLDGGKPNHPDHAGYISWSPKEQFDNGYVAAGTVSSYPAHVQRICAEKAQLIDRAEKLRNFLRSVTYHNMAKIDKQLLIAQLNVMESYRIVFEMRIQRFLEAQAE